jgi:hypothetical protein
MPHAISQAQKEKLSSDLSGLATLSDADLKVRWRNLYGTEAPRCIHRSLLISAIAHRVQERALGDLRSSTRRHLMRVASGAADACQSRNYPGLSLRPGTVLVRDWGGVTHQAKVLQGEVLFRGKRYKSLSEVARLITGARWSGPLFFGLKVRAKEKSNGSR